jgi:site-specific recombinase XerD
LKRTLPADRRPGDEHARPHVAGVLHRPAIAQRHASGHTIAAYRDTLRLLLGYASERTGVPPSRLELADLNAPLIAAFLDHLETERGNTVRTRNARLAAIHTEPQVDALLDSCDLATWTGRRDHALLLLAVQTGLRISELTGLTRANIHLGAGAHVACHGKGRKDRIIPLTAATATVLVGLCQVGARDRGRRDSQRGAGRRQVGQAPAQQASRTCSCSNSCHRVRPTPPDLGSAAVPG